MTGTAAVVGAALLPVAGFYMTGTSANIPAGSDVKAFLDEDLRIAAGNSPRRPARFGGGPGRRVTLPC